MAKQVILVISTDYSKYSFNKIVNTLLNVERQQKRCINYEIMSLDIGKRSGIYFS